MECKVVEFVSQQEVAVVNVSWLNDDETRCYWPTMMSVARLTNAVKSGMPPNDNWEEYAVKVLYSTSIKI